MKTMKQWWPILLLSLIPSPALALPTLTTTPTAIVGSLDLDGEGSASAHIVKVADISFSTTNVLGLTLNVSSSAITKPNGGNINFRVITVPDNAAAPLTAAFTVPSGAVHTYRMNLLGNGSRDLYILYTPAALQDPGTYTGAINVWAVDN